MKNDKICITDELTVGKIAEDDPLAGMDNSGDKNESTQMLTKQKTEREKIENIEKEKIRAKNRESARRSRATRSYFPFRTE